MIQGGFRNSSKRFRTVQDHLSRSSLERFRTVPDYFLTSENTRTIPDYLGLFGFFEGLN